MDAVYLEIREYVCVFLWSFVLLAELFGGSNAWHEEKWIILPNLHGSGLLLMDISPPDALQYCK